MYIVIINWNCNMLFTSSLSSNGWI